MKEILLDGAPVENVQWNGETGTIDIGADDANGNAWGTNQPVQLRVVVDGIASEPVTVIVGPPPTLDDEQTLSGAPETDVTVKGTNLGRSPGSVHVGDTVAGVTTWTDAAVTFTIPRTAKGLVDLQLVVHGYGTNVVGLRVCKTG